MAKHIVTILFAVTIAFLPIHVYSEAKTGRVIIVDQNLVIKRIINYTESQEKSPVILLENTGGVELPYTDSIKAQYENLKKKLDFKAEGVIYEKKTTIGASIIDLILYFIRQLINLGK